MRIPIFRILLCCLLALFHALWTKFFHHKKKVAVIAFLILLPPLAGQIKEIRRNTSWNETMKELSLFHDDLAVVHAWLKRNENSPRMPELDVAAAKKLNDAIERNEKIGKHLKKVQEELEAGR